VGAELRRKMDGEEEEDLADQEEQDPEEHEDVEEEVEDEQAASSSSEQDPESASSDSDAEAGPQERAPSSLNPATESLLLSAPRTHKVEAAAGLTAAEVGQRVLAQASPAPNPAYSSDAIWQFEDDRQKLEPAEKEEADEPDEWAMGWGSWVGQGIQPRKKKRDHSPKQEAKKAKKDFDPSVIKVSVAPSAKYTVKKVPFPYTSAEQYEADIATPSGKEWNAKLAFDALKQPGVIVRSGAYIDPIKYVEPEDPKGSSKSEVRGKAGAKTGSGSGKQRAMAARKGLSKKRPQHKQKK
jgi:U3 small nucleolar RNA-associated protein 14